MMNKVLVSLALIFSSHTAFAAKAASCKQTAEKMAIAFFQVNYPNDSLLTVGSTLVDMKSGYGEGDEGLGSETWDVNLNVYFQEAGFEGELAPIEVQLRVDGTDCKVTNVSMPTAG